MFSIIIPLYNKAAYIERCLESVFNQTFIDHEIIVINDGSTDNGAQIVEKKYPDIKLIKQTNQGVSVARNKGIDNATRDYIAFLDADDYWSPYYLAKIAQVINIENQPDILGASFSRKKEDIEVKDNELVINKFENFFKRKGVNLLYTSSSVVIKKDFFIENKGFDENLKRGEDLDLWIRVSEKAKKAILIKNILSYYSDEDQRQATAIGGKLKDSILGIINDKHQTLLNKNNRHFNSFISKFIYYHLVNYYFNENQHIDAKKVLCKSNKRFFILEWPYWLPFKVGKKINETPFLKKLLLYYYKIMFKVI